jgi:hypothetical protein
MRILVLDTIYQAVLNEIETNLRTKDHKSFEEMRQDILSNRFGTSGCYERYFNESGHECLEIVTNSVLVQSAWAKEHKIRLLNTIGWDKSFFLSRTKALQPFLTLLRQFHFLVLQQVKFYDPDILIIKDLHEYPPTILQQFKKSRLKLVGFCSSVVVETENFREYDLIFSSVPENLEVAIRQGVKAERIFPAFDTRNVSFESRERDISISFVGSLYQGTVPMLLAAIEVDPTLQIYAPNPSALDGEKSLMNNYVGNVWGLEMYKVFGRSKITLNRHGAIAANFAGNMRLFEATGMGACLVTESRPNLVDLFDPITEVVPYEDSADMQLKLERLLASDELRSNIAKSGQQRCLKQHSYAVRIQEIIKSLER